MENFFLNFPMKAETVVPFIGVLESFENELDKSAVKVTDAPVGRVYVNSPGGELAYGMALYHFFANSDYVYEFVLLESTDSCALFLMLALCPERLTIYNGSSGMLHQVGYTIDTRSLPLEDKYYSKRRLNHLHKTNASIIELLKPVLTKEEVALYKDGEDVYLSTERMQEIFEKIKGSKTLQNRMKKIFELE